MKKIVMLSTVILLASTTVDLKAQGEDAVLAIMQQKIIKQEASDVFEKKCLPEANTLEEANICLKKSHKMGSGRKRTKFDSWNEAEKQKAIAELDKSIEIGECIKKAKTFMEMNINCMK